MYVPKVVIIGGGFAGLAAAEALKNSPVKVVVIDRQNHHTFSPLLYQAASSLLSPTDIGAPLRHLLRKNLNTTVILGEVSGIDTAARSVTIDTCERLAQQLQYDYLIVASGVETSYAGHDDFESHAPGLKSLHDAAIIRNKILNAFEQAEIEEDPAVSNEWLTFVLVGGGPTGVEMEGTIAAMVRLSLEGEFRRIDPNRTRIIVVDGGRRLLAGYSPQISAQVKARLESQRVPSPLRSRTPMESLMLFAKDTVPSQRCSTTSKSHWISRPRLPAPATPPATSIKYRCRQNSS